MPGLSRGEGQVKSQAGGGSEHPPTPAKKKMAKTTRPRSKSTKGIRSKSRTPNLTPLQAQLEETQMYIKPHMDDISACRKSEDRLVMVYRLLPDDVTSIDRLWPLELKNKDSRLRIDLSEQGKDCFVAGDHKKSLDLYNRALTYSSGKGIAHTLARRAAFFLATKEHQLALRDLTIALEYGVLETEELLDFLLTHHTSEDTGTAYDNGEQMMSKTIENIHNMHNEKGVPDNQKYMWAKKIKENLNAALLTKKKKGAVTKDDILKNIVESINAAAKEQNLNVNLECEELVVPTVESRNPIYPAFSEAAAVFKEVGDDKGRHVKARRDILAGEVIAVDEPHCSMLCPQDFEQIKNHCLHCFRYIRAPLPCEVCCCVVFCSKECKSLACNSYHKYECLLRLYELLPQEGQDVFGLFMSLRSITQKPLEYFMEHQDVLEKYLDRDEAKPVVQEGRYLSSDYKTLLNLVTHASDLSEDIIMRNTVLSIVFLRSLQYSGYFSKHIKPRMKGDRFSITPIETLILRLLYHLIAVQSFNSHPIMRLSVETGSFNWDKIGTCINPSMALFNHSCNANTVRCNVNRSSILVAASHIPAGEEITDSYAVHFSNTDIDRRQYHTLKNYNFGCECPACVGKWKMGNEVPDELARVPNFEQEANFKIRFGDKKFIVDDIRDARRLAELCMNKRTFEDALNAYQDLCQLLEEHVRKPHAYFLQARAGIVHCVWNKFCKPPCNTDEEIDEEEFLSGKNNPIYMNNVVENITEINIHNINPSNNEEDEHIDSEKADLIRRTKALVKSSMDKAKDAKQVVLQNKQTAIAGTASDNSSSMCGKGKSELEPWVVDQYKAEQNRKHCVGEELEPKEMEYALLTKEFMLKEQKKAEEAAKKKFERQEDEKVRIAEAQIRKLERQQECEERSKRLIQQDKERRQHAKEKDERILAERKSRKDKEIERRQEKEIEEKRIEREKKRQKEEEELASLLYEKTSGNDDECLDNLGEDDMIANLLKDLDNEEFLVEHNQDKTMTVIGENEDEFSNKLETTLLENEIQNNLANNEKKVKENVKCNATILQTTAEAEKKLSEINHIQCITNLENEINESTILGFSDRKTDKSNDTLEREKIESDKQKSATIETNRIKLNEQRNIDQLQNKEKDKTNGDKNVAVYTETIDNLDDFISSSMPKKAPEKEDEDPGNVWAILRKIKDASYSENQENLIRKEQQELEDTIKNFAEIINKKKKSQQEEISHKKKCAKISADMETIEEDVLIENTATKESSELNSGSDVKSSKEDTISKVSMKEEVPPSKRSMLSCIENSETFFKEAEKFDYATWRDKTVINVTPIEELSAEKLASDREYLESLRNKIHTNIEKKKEIEKKDEKKEKKNILPKLNKGKPEKKSPTESESFETLKSKDRERKQKKRDEKTKAAFEGAQDKTREVNLKSNQIEKRTEEQRKNIERLKEKSIALRKLSELREMEFNDIRFDDLSSLDTKTKKGRKAARQTNETPISLTESLHWTEEETNAWPVADPDKVHSMLGAIKAAAAASASKGKKIDGKSFADDLKNKIKICQNEIEMERKQKEEEVKKKNAAEMIKVEQAMIKKPSEKVYKEKTKEKVQESLPIKNSKDAMEKTSEKTMKETEALGKVTVENSGKSTTSMKNCLVVTNVGAENGTNSTEKQKNKKVDDKQEIGDTTSTQKNNIDKQEKAEITNNLQKSSAASEVKDIPNKKVIKTSETVSRSHVESKSRNKVPSMRWSGSELFPQDSSESSDSLYSANEYQEIKNVNMDSFDKIKSTQVEDSHLQQQKAKEEAEIRKKEIEREIELKEKEKLDKKENERKRKQQEQENSIKKKAAEMLKIEEAEAKIKLEKKANENRKEKEREEQERKAALDAKKKKEIENIAKLKLEKEAKIKKKEAKVAEEQKRIQEEAIKEDVRKKAIEEAENALRKIKEEMDEKKRTAEALAQKKLLEEAALITRKKDEANEEHKNKIQQIKEKSKELVKQQTLNRTVDEESRINTDNISRTAQKELKIKKTEKGANIMKETTVEHDRMKKTIVDDAEMEKNIESKKNKKESIKESEDVTKDELNKTKKNTAQSITENEVKVKPNLMIVNTNTDLEVSPVSLRKMPPQPPRKEVLSMRWSGAEMFQDQNQESNSSFKLEVNAPTIYEDNVVEVKIKLPEMKTNAKTSLNSGNSKTAEEVFEESILETMKQRIPSPMQIDEYAENVKRYSENNLKPNISPEPPITRQSKKEIFHSQNEGNLSEHDKMRSQSVCGAPPQARKRSQSIPRPPPPKFKPPPPPPI